MLYDVQSIFIWCTAAVSLAVLVVMIVGSKRVAAPGAPESSPTPRVLSGGQTSAGAGRVRILVPTAAENPLDQWTGQRLRQEERKDELRQRMIHAGIYGTGAVVTFTVLRLMLMVGPAMLGFLASRWGQIPVGRGVLFGLIAGMAGTLAPTMWLDHVKGSRQKKIRRALPDALDVIVICLQGGLSLPASIARVARELALAHPMLAVELSIVERHIQMGRSTGEAVREMARRFDLEELRSLAAVIVQAERIGSGVVTAMEVYADSLRLRRNQHAEEMAQKAAVKILFPTVLFIFPAMFIVILGPAVIRISETLLPVLNGK